MSVVDRDQNGLGRVNVRVQAVAALEAVDGGNAKKLSSGGAAGTEAGCIGDEEPGEEPAEEDLSPPLNVPEALGGNRDDNLAEDDTERVKVGGVSE